MNLSSIIEETNLKIEALRLISARTQQIKGDLISEIPETIAVCAKAEETPKDPRSGLLPTHERQIGEIGQIISDIQNHLTNIEEYIGIELNGNPRPECLV